GSDGKANGTTKILSDARRWGGVAARGARGATRSGATDRGLDVGYRRIRREIDAVRHDSSHRVKPSERLAEQQDAERRTENWAQIAKISRRLRADSHHAKIPTRETNDARGNVSPGEFAHRSPMPDGILSLND